jgi:hypothetical protein
VYLSFRVFSQISPGLVNLLTLQCRLRLMTCSENNGILVFPDGLLEETLRTLALLLPQHDTSTRKWYQRHYSKLSLDNTAIKCGQLNSEDRQIERFRFWHDRLVILKQVFDDTEPSTVKQWWRDRRKRVQWYTFWVAAMVLALTVLFGVVQCVEGGLQAWKAYHP